MWPLFESIGSSRLCDCKNEKKYGGCRSWIDLPEMEGSVLVSVISDEEHQRRRELLERLLNP